LVTIYLVYCLYCQITSYTEISYHNESKLITNIILQSKLKEHKFRPYFFFPSTLLQTILMPLIHNPDVFSSRREEINKYGTHIDWIELNKTIPMNECTFTNNRLLIILPGITGGTNDPYISNIAYEAVKNHYKVIIFQNRLLSTSLSFTYEGYYDLVDDFNETVSYIENNYPEYDLYAFGNSNGANGLVRFLGKYNTVGKGKQRKNRILGAVSLANPFCMKKTEEAYKSTLYESLLTYILHKKMDVVNHPDLIVPKELNLDLESARNATTLNEFHRHLIMKVHGFDDLDKFYNSQRSIPYIKKIKIPTLMVNSVDDQIAHKSVFPLDDIKANKYIAFMTTKYGGHLCWIDNSSLFSLKQWPMKVGFDFLNQV